MKGRHAHKAELVRAITERLAPHTAAEWEASFEAADVPCTRLRSVPDILADPQALAIGALATVHHPTLGPVRMLGVPVRLTDTPGAPAGPPPAVGEHTDDVLAEAGLSPEDDRRPPAGGRRPVTARRPRRRGHRSPARPLACRARRGDPGRTGSHHHPGPEDPMGTIRVLSPVAESKVSQSAPPAPAGDLAGKTLGFLDNTKANFELLAPTMEGLLREQRGPDRGRLRPEGQLLDPRPRPRSSRGCGRPTWSSPAPPTEGPARRGVSTTP